VEAEQRAAERKTEHDKSGAGYIRWSGNSKFRHEARPGDLVIQAWTPTRKSLRGKIFAPAPLLRCRAVGNVTHFFIEEYADAEDTAIPYGAFKKLWAELGGSDTLTVKSTREIPVELLEAARSLWPAPER
jgi:hypothetical protein